MRKKICKKCGRVFETPDNYYDRYLCPECLKRVRKEGIHQEHTCIICGDKFMGFPSSKYCPNCAKIAERERAKKYRKNGVSRPLGSIDHCKKCGAAYVVTSGLQKYCPNCSQEAIKENSRARKREYNRENREKLLENKIKMKANGYVCVICGKVFNKKSPTVTCSPECAKELKRRNQINADLKRGMKRTPIGELRNNSPKS